jgi:hypothetical protein
VDDDLVAGLPARDAVADLSTRRRRVRAADVVVLFVVANTETRLAERRPNVVVVHARGHHPQDDLHRARLGHLHLPGAERFALAEAGTQTTPTDAFHLKGAVDRWTVATRKAGNNCLDLCEKTVDQLADLEVKTAKAIKLPIVSELAEAHAAMWRKVADACVSTARELYKA